jgi:putative transcription factor
LTLTCEVCGAKIGGPPDRVEIDGAFLWVCPSCARRGTPLAATPRTFGGPVLRPRSIARGQSAPELEIDPEYPSIVRHAREKMGLTQEQLGRTINVKPSVIRHVETAKMRPDILLARKLMHQLKVNLLVPSEELDSASP